MKIKRFVARDMRTALNEVKEELGVDAVIMSNKKVAEGVEIVAAIDYDSPKAAETKQPEPTQSPTRASTLHAVADEEDRAPVMHPSHEPIKPTAEFEALLNNAAEGAINNDKESIASSLEALLSRQHAIKAHKAGATHSQSTPTAKQAQPARPNRNNHLNSKPANLARGFDTLDKTEKTHAPKAAYNQTASHHQTATSETASVQHQADMQSMKGEIASLRKLLEHQVSGLLWQELERKEPLRAMLIKKLKALGICDEVADQMACFIPEDLADHEAWPSVLELLEGQLSTTRNDVIHKGGVYAFVGPTGVGKTTTIAKLAAQYAKMHGAEHIGLITTDTYRIGAHEQLATYGKIMGCPVKIAKDATELEALLKSMRSKKLVLIDTAGLSQRDLRLTQQLDTLITSTNINIKTYLVLSANAQRRVLEESIEHFKRIALSGCIFTKLDESLSLGEIISVAIQNALPIGYLTDGQRVPEDIKVASAKKLVENAADLLDSQSGSEHVWYTQTEPQAVGMYE
ncbi:flagellar biosynthesis protein FlhF [Flocculibacter collagenilyticus]|uniref:flagellar biosynthesis protein FlhF n=1 Tax=Flocculibacter collagenilyticus TaxID=2744479 RepID=UPI0018F54136|nr:flagellar biosynthesis protein FlhF [Flocculibacter collagenilyticus]